MRIRLWTWIVLVLPLLAAGCGEVPTAPPAQEPTAVAQRPTEPRPPTITPLPYPMPTPEPPPTLEAQPTSTPGPTPIVLGAEWAPESEREVYVSTTVVIAPVGDGPGEVGFYIPPCPPGGEDCPLPITAEKFTVDTHGNIYILDVVNQRVVRFDPQGQFVANIVYGDAVQGPGDLAVDADGRVYIYEAAAYGPTPEEAVPKVKLFDPDGKLLWETPVPSWFADRAILAMRVDEQGTLWVEGEGYSPNATIIEGQPYSKMAVPLGSATEILDEEHQRTAAISGHLLSSGKNMIVYSLTAAGPAFVYNSYGQRIYRIVDGISGMDLTGNLYWIQYKDGGQGYTIIKWDTQGRRISSFDLPFGIIRIEGNGMLYCLTMDRETWSTYYMIRAQPK